MNCNITDNSERSVLITKQGIIGVDVEGEGESQNDQIESCVTLTIVNERCP